MIQQMLRTVTARHQLMGTDLGEYRKMQLGGGTVRVYAFYAQGLGHVSALSVGGFLGLRQEDTLIVNPTDVDLPLYVCRRVRSPGSETLTCELFDTVLGCPDLSGLDAVQKQAASLPDFTPVAGWDDGFKLPGGLWKKGGKACRDGMDHAAMAYLENFLEMVQTAEPSDPGCKLRKVSAYVDALLQNAGTSVDVFRRGLGEERTVHFFQRILYGTEI